LHVGPSFYVRPGITNDEVMSFITAGRALLDDHFAEMPLARVGTVDDVARIVRFLLSDEPASMAGRGHRYRSPALHPRRACHQVVFG
jgi:NAD(P)-dependent dehydrogenase (short-subunit alcohol dehydrogenase family)